jgi:uncharacterized integral membrane protein
LRRAGKSVDSHFSTQPTPISSSLVKYVPLDSRVTHLHAMSVESIELAEPTRRRGASLLIYRLMAMLFVIIAIASFAPTSFGLLTSVAAGERPWPPLILHVHAAAMTGWLILLLAQTTLIAYGRRDLHRTLGLASLVLAAVVLIAMIGIVFDTAERYLAVEADAGRAGRLLLINGSSIVLFPAFYAWAILVRKADSETHRRMLILATAVLMIPAIGRLLIRGWIPDFGLNGADARHLYELLLLAPVLLHDTLRRGSPHPAYVVGVVAIASWTIGAHLLWDSVWWSQTAAMFVGKLSTP